jgi:hypothetical protein
MDLRVGDIVEFYVHEQDGRTFLAIECPRVENKIEAAKRTLREAGIKVD